MEHGVLLVKSYMMVIYVDFLNFNCAIIFLGWHFNVTSYSLLQSLFSHNIQ